MSKTYYEILGLNLYATLDQIKSAYRDAAHKYHPDLYSGDPQIFLKIKEAYEILSDKKKKADYDKKLKKEKIKDFTSFNRSAELDIHIDTTITLTDIYLYGHKKIQYTYTVDDIPHTKDIFITLSHIKENKPIMYTGGGHIKNGEAGNTYISFTFKNDNQYFIINESNLEYIIILDFLELYNGIEIELYHLDDSILLVKIPPKTLPGKRFKIKNKGFINGNTRDPLYLRIEFNIFSITEELFNTIKI